MSPCVNYQAQSRICPSTSTQHTLTLRCFVPEGHQKSKRLSCNLGAVVLLKLFQRTSFHFMDNSESPFREEIDVLPGIFPLERWSELRVRADKDNVSHQLRTTNKKAELMREFLKMMQLKTCVSIEETANSPSPGAQSSDLPKTRQTGSTSTGSRVLRTWVHQAPLQL